MEKKKRKKKQEEGNEKERKRKLLKRNRRRDDDDSWRAARALDKPTSHITRVITMRKNMIKDKIIMIMSELRERNEKRDNNETKLDRATQHQKKRKDAHVEMMIMICCS